jgi:DNA-binding response OmpR family regulator
MQHAYFQKVASVLNSAIVFLRGVRMSGPAQFSLKICFADFELNLETAELRNNGNKTMLPGQPFQVLVTLLDRPGELVTREELKKRLWASETFVDFDQSLHKAIKPFTRGTGGLGGTSAVH